MFGYHGLFQTVVLGGFGRIFDEPKKWKILEINDIMNNSVIGWRVLSNPRYSPSPYGRQKGWERVQPDPDQSFFEDRCQDFVVSLSPVGLLGGIKHGKANEHPGKSAL